MGDSLDVPQAHWQQGLGTVQSLDLGLLIDAEHHRLVGWVQVKANDVPHLFDKERIGGQLERLLSVRLQREGLQPAVNR